MDAYAAWLAGHALPMFLLAPAVAAGTAWLLWRWAAGLPPGLRVVRLYGGLAGAAAACFAMLAWSVRGQGGLVAFDHALAGHLGAAAPPGLLRALSWFTHLGDRDFLALLAIGMTVLLLARRRWMLAAACVAATAGGGGLNWALKRLFQRARPDYAHGYAAVDGWSFPSGHASAAMAVYGMACYLLLRAVPVHRRGACAAGMAALIAAIGASRVLLQVHFASDVAAGFAVSAAWLALCVAAAEHGLRRPGAGG